MSELPPITFGSAGNAYRWAEEAASLTDVKSPTWLVIRSMQQIPGRGFDDWSRDDYRDLALTILSEVSNLEDGVTRTAFQHAHGLACEERHDDLATRLAKILMLQHPTIGYGPLKRVTMIAVGRSRARIRRDRPLPFAHYGRALGMERRAPYEMPWREIIMQAEKTYEEWVRRADLALVERLRAIGVM